MALEAKLKTALDETRLLILGSQVLFGFQLNGIFQEGFGELSRLSRGLDASAFVLMALCIGLLIAPSMQHRLVERGQDSARLHGATTRFAALALLPLAVGLGLDFYLVLERQIGTAAAAAIGAAFFLLAIGLWIVLGRLLGRPPEKAMSDEDAKPTPLHARIEQMLTEARVLLPGAQALLGFQFAIMLNKTFEQLPQSSKLIHIGALLMIALTVILLITPAAIHRITFGGEDTERFHRIGSYFVVAAAVPLGLGIAADTFVAVGRAADSQTAGIVTSAAVLLTLAALWFLQPLMLRGQRKA